MMKLTREMIIATIQARYIEDIGHPQNSVPTDGKIKKAMDELHITNDKLTKINTDTAINLQSRPTELKRAVSDQCNPDGITQQEMSDINAFANKLQWPEDSSSSPTNIAANTDQDIIVDYVKDMMELNQKLSEKHCCSRLLAWLGCHSITTKKEKLKAEVTTIMHAWPNQTKQTALRQSCS